MSKPRRPAPIIVGDARARVVRGPNAEGRFYWRWWRGGSGARDDGGGALGWRTREEASEELGAVAKSGVEPAHRDVKSIRDVLETWAASQQARSDLSPATIAQRLHVGRMLARVIGDVRIERVTRETLENYRAVRLREPARYATTTRDGRKLAGELKRMTSLRTVRLELETLRLAWRWATDIGAIPGDRELPRFTVRLNGWTRNRTTPTREQVAAVLAELKGWARLAVVLLACTGCRKGEVLSLTWADVDLDGETLTVRGKVGRRCVPLGGAAVEALADARAALDIAAGPVFAGSKHTTTAIDLPVARACERAGVPVFAVGALRRYAVRELYRAGVDPAVAASVVGHSPAVAMAHYRQVSEEERAEAVARARLVAPAADAGKVVEIGAGRRGRAGG